MNASLQFPFDLRWTSHDLADAVPLRLSELPEFNAHQQGHGAESANAPSLGKKRWSTASRREAEPQLFRIC